MVQSWKFLKVKYHEGLTKPKISSSPSKMLTRRKIFIIFLWLVFWEPNSLAFHLLKSTFDFYVLSRPVSSPVVYRFPAILAIRKCRLCESNTRCQWLADSTNWCTNHYTKATSMFWFNEHYTKSDWSLWDKVQSLNRETFLL